MINDHQKYDEKMFSRMNEKFEDLNKKVEKNSRFVIGSLAVITTIVTVLQVTPPLIRVLTSKTSAVTMDIVRPVVRELS